MKQTELGNSRIMSSGIGLGTSAVGRWTWGGMDEQESIAIFHPAVELAN